jgi:hypothetical protein
MNEKLEIGGDLQDEYLAIQEADECNRDAPLPAPLTDEELDDWAAQWEAADTPDLNLIGHEPDGTNVYAFETLEDRYLRETYPE